MPLPARIFLTDSILLSQIVSSSRSSTVPPPTRHTSISPGFEPISIICPIISSIALAAYLISMIKHEGVMDTVTYSWSGLGCSFGPLVLMALYYPKTNKYGAVAGILSGGTIAAAWGYLGVTFQDNNVPAMIPGFTVAVLMIYVVSRLTTKKTR